MEFETTWVQNIESLQPTVMISMGEFDTEIVYLIFLQQDISLHHPSYLYPSLNPQYPHCLCTFSLTCTCPSFSLDNTDFLVTCTFFDAFMMDSFILWYCFVFGLPTVCGLAIAFEDVGELILTFRLTVSDKERKSFFDFLNNLKEERFMSHCFKTYGYFCAFMTNPFSEFTN